MPGIVGRGRGDVKACFPSCRERSKNEPQEMFKFVQVMEDLYASGCFLLTALGCAARLCSVFECLP